MGVVTRIPVASRSANHLEHSTEITKVPDHCLRWHWPSLLCALVLISPNAAYASLEARAKPHRVIKSGTGEVNPTSDQRRTFRRLPRPRSRCQLSPTLTTQRGDRSVRYEDHYCCTEHGARSMEHGARSTEDGKNGAPKRDMYHDLRFQTPLMDPPSPSRPALNPRLEERSVPGRIG